jgi:hypothetical protein
MFHANANRFTIDVSAAVTPMPTAKPETNRHNWNIVDEIIN